MADELLHVGSANQFTKALESDQGVQSREGEVCLTAAEDGTPCLQPRDHEGCDMKYGMVKTGDAYEASLVPGKVESNQQLIFSDLEKKEFSILVQKFLETRHQTGSRPLPVLLGGEEVNLLNLNVQVRAMGGYDAAHGKWSLIAENLGLGPECGPGLKLVYVKYLKALESWTQLTGKEDGNGLQSHLSPTRINLMMTRCAESKQCNSFECKKPLKGSSQEGEVGSFVKEVERQLVNEGNLFQDNPELHPVRNICETTSKRRRLGPMACLSSVSGHSTEGVTDGTRLPTVKGHEYLTGLLEWIKRIALNPGDPKRGQGPRGSKQNEIWVEQCVARASRIRALLWKKKEFVPVHSLRDFSLGLVNASNTNNSKQ